MDKQIRFNYQSSRQRDDNSEGTRVLLDFALCEPDYKKRKKKKEACVEVAVNGGSKELRGRVQVFLSRTGLSHPYLSVFEATST